MCSHALAVVYEAQKREMFGGEITDDANAPDWLTGEPVRETRSRPGQWRLDVAAALQSHARAIGSRRSDVLKSIVMDDIQQSEALGQIASMASAIREDKISLSSMTNEPLSCVASIPISLIFPVQYHGEIQTVISVDADAKTCTLFDGRVVPSQECLHPAYDSASGLRIVDDFMSREQEIEESVGSIVPVSVSHRTHSILNEDPEPALPKTDAADEEMDEPISDENPVEEAAGIEMMSSSDPFSPGGEALAWIMKDNKGGDGFDIAAAAKSFLEKTAVREFSAAEQAEIIGEGESVRATNLDLLQIEGTHYMSISDEYEDDQFLW